MRCGCTDALHARLEDEGKCDDALKALGAEHVNEL